MTNKYTAIKKVKGFSSAYPNVCNLKILPNIDKTWITIQDDVGTSITIKLSDLELAISIIKAESEEKSIPYLMHKEMNIPLLECQKAYDIAIDYLRRQGKVRG